MMDKHDLVSVLNYYGCNARDNRSWSSVKCVLHNDKHASASVSPDKEMFFCFVCDFEGDVYKVIMAKEGITRRQDAISRAEIITNGNRRKVSQEFKRRDSLLPQIKRDKQRNRRYIPTRYS
jgi:DNA primase